MTSAPIGEIWFEDEWPGTSELLVKYLFTSAPLSIQVHPDDARAHVAGLPRGKSEGWFILDATPGATIGMGFTRAVTEAEVRHAITDGSITGLIDWRPVEAGQFLYSPAGTVHAIGAGLRILEIQQNLDLTYRLYDHGRPRELHVDAGVEAAALAPAPPPVPPIQVAPGRWLLCTTGPFTVERWQPLVALRVDGGDAELLLIPLHDGGRLDGAPLRRGSVWRVDGGATLDDADAADLIVAYAGPVRPDLATSRA